MVYSNINIRYFFLLIYITMFLGCSDTIDTTTTSDIVDSGNSARYWSSSCDRLLLINSQDKYQICYGFVGSDETKKASLAGNYDLYRVEIQRYSPKYNSSIVIFRNELGKKFIEAIDEKSRFFSPLYELDNSNIYIYPNYPSLTTVISQTNIINSPPWSIPYEHIE